MILQEIFQWLLLHSPGRQISYPEGVRQKFATILRLFISNCNYKYRHWTVKIPKRTHYLRIVENSWNNRFLSKSNSCFFLYKFAPLPIILHSTLVTHMYFAYIIVLLSMYFWCVILFIFLIHFALFTIFKMLSHSFYTFCTKK